MNAAEKIQAAKDKAAKIKKNVSVTVGSSKTRLVKRIYNKVAHSSQKVAKDVKEIIELIDNLEPDSICHVISNCIDSPNILKAFDASLLKKVTIATWALTEAGLMQLKYLSDNNVKVDVLLDATYSYKWMFQSGAISMFEKNIKFHFDTTHMKMQLFEFNTGEVLGFIGSMNLSNNPRFENMFITNNLQTFMFYKDVVDSIINKKFETQFTLL